MKRQSIARRTRIALAIVSVAAIFIGIGLTQGQLWGSATHNSINDIYGAISQSVQSGLAASGVTMSGPGLSQSSSLVISDGTASGQLCIGSPVCPPYTCEQETQVVMPCNPFAELIGRWVTIHLDTRLTVAGILMRECSGWLILKDGDTTYTVQISKVIVIESN